MIVCPLIRSVGLKAATASSRVATVDTADVFQRVVLKVDELHRAEVERHLTVGRASGADDVGAGLTCELRHHRPD
jgi:hypothetical protein